MELTRFDIVVGHYVFCSLWHEGQGSDKYKRLCRIREYFTPGAAFSESKVLDPDNEEYENARYVYENLCANHGVNDE